jgi:hypothetical protein
MSGRQAVVLLSGGLEIVSAAGRPLSVEDNGACFVMKVRVADVGDDFNGRFDFVLDVR